jgi:isopentenyl-diphosphate delta-isomerase type 1
MVPDLIFATRGNLMHGHYSTDNEILEIVDSDDRVVGTATRREIHEQGLCHRAVHIFVFNSHGKIFIQRRSAAKDRHPLKLGSSAAGHVDPGESYETTAVRELEEELGIKAQVTRVLSVKAQAKTGHEHVALFSVTTDDLPVPNQAEIVWGSFMTQERLTELMHANPEDFVPAFVLLWHAFTEQKA